MTDVELRAIRARCEAATPGPWAFIGGTEDERDWDDVMLQGVGEVFVANIGGGPKHPDDGVSFDSHVADAAFIAHARTDIGLLLAEVERLRGLVSRLRETFAVVCVHCDFLHRMGTAEKEGRSQPPESRLLPGGTVHPLRLATHAVSWSDRVLEVCADHIERAKQAAANDGSSDRTDHPYVEELGQPAILTDDEPAVDHA